MMSALVTDHYRTAFGAEYSPFAFQQAVAIEGFPEVLDVPTGCGKTAALMLGWLFRRRFHPDAAVREDTPRRLIWCMPLRTLTQQTFETATTWVRNLGLADEVGVHLLMGGESNNMSDVRANPDADCIILGTLDMCLSRALNRGYVASRYVWPIDFALFNNDCHWVFDETQLMGVSLTTSRQLFGLRQQLGAQRTGSTWMSATVDHSALLTVDAPELGRVDALGSDQMSNHLRARVFAPKTLVTRPIDDAKKPERTYADLIEAERSDGTTVLCTVNTVQLAQAIAAEFDRRYKPVKGVAPVNAPEVVLLHSRFRAADRAEALRRALEPAESGRSKVVVSTQVVEAGVDMSVPTLITECAPWSSIVQRAGRCNRWGEAPGARFVVVRSLGKGPYLEADVERAWVQATSMSVSEVTPQLLASVEIASAAPPHMTLRRADLLELFDTTPDVFGNDIDVSRFIREDGDLNVEFFWRSSHLPEPTESTRPDRSELCGASISDARKFLADRAARNERLAHVVDDSSGVWRVATPDDVRPGATIRLSAQIGGYSAERGFLPSVKATVDPIVPVGEPAPTLESDEVIGDDDMSVQWGVPVLLADHLGHVEAEAISLCSALGESEPVTQLIGRAGRLHDLGKAHPIWQEAVHALSAQPSEAEDQPDQVLAKSGSTGRLHYPGRRGFRHEWASALVLVRHPDLILDEGSDSDRDLIVYLVAAHHGRVRIGVRAASHECTTVLGLEDGEVMPAVDLGRGLLSPATTISTGIAQVGFGADGRSWTDRSLSLLDRYGPFRLAWLEMLLRIADWRASAAEGAAMPNELIGTAAIPASDQSEGASHER